MSDGFDAAAAIAPFTQEFDDIVRRIDDALTRFGRRDTMRVQRFPPVLPRAIFERSGFAASFPQLFGAVHAFQGPDPRELQSKVESGEDWGPHLSLTDYVLTPAACYPLYPQYEGFLGTAPVTADIEGYCFRHEPSDEPGRLVSFRQREFVSIGTETTAIQWFQHWQQAALEFVTSLGLAADRCVAADPFFGSGGRLLKASQREQSLKFEILAPLRSQTVALASVNLHRDHFGTRFAIETTEGPAHTCCVGFGLERLAFALLDHHGADSATWPATVREFLWC